MVTEWDFHFTYRGSYENKCYLRVSHCWDKDVSALLLNILVDCLLWGICLSGVWAIILPFIFEPSFIALFCKVPVVVPSLTQRLQISFYQSTSVLNEKSVVVSPHLSNFLFKFTVLITLHFNLLSPRVLFANIWPMFLQLTGPFSVLLKNQTYFESMCLDIQKHVSPVFGLLFPISFLCNSHLSFH